MQLYEALRRVLNVSWMPHPILHNFIELGTVRPLHWVGYTDILMANRKDPFD